VPPCLCLCVSRSGCVCCRTSPLLTSHRWSTGELRHSAGWGSWAQGGVPSRHPQAGSENGQLALPPTSSPGSFQHSPTLWGRFALPCAPVPQHRVPRGDLRRVRRVCILGARAYTYGPYAEAGVREAVGGLGYLEFIPRGSRGGERQQRQRGPRGPAAAEGLLLNAGGDDAKERAQLRRYLQDRLRRWGLCSAHLWHLCMAPLAWGRAGRAA